jgi:hypothetical protein
MADAAQPAIPGEYPPLHGGKLFFLTVAIATASFMEILDMTSSMSRYRRFPEASA